MKRRSFIPLMIAATSARSLASIIPNEAHAKNGLTICVQAWSFNRFTLFEAIEKASIAGAQAIEIFTGQTLSPEKNDIKVSVDMSADDIAALKAHAKKHNIVIVNHGVTDIPSDEAGARKHFEFAKTLGLYGVTTESLESLPILEKLAVEYDVKVCFHNHPSPTKLWNPDTVWNAIQNSPAQIGYCADLGHWATSGLNPLDVVKKIATRIHSFHFKDRAEIGKATHDQPLGTGILDLHAILAEVKKHNFAGNVSIEYEYNWDNNVPDISQCVGYLRGVNA